MSRRVGFACAVVVFGALAAGCRPAPAPPSPVPPDTWAEVDGRQITRQQVEAAFRRTQDASQPLSDEERLTIQLNLLENLIVEDILLARARGLKLEVLESDVDSAYGEARKNVPDDVFQQELTKRNLTVEDMRDGIRRELLVQKLFEQEVESKIAVTDQEVADFFNANRAQFNLTEDAFHLAQIVVTPVQEPQLANRTGDDATTPQAAAAKASMLMERLKSGASFGDLARDFSEDPESAPRGGDLGFVPRSALDRAPPALRSAVLQMAPGNARAISQGGAHTILYLVAREEAGQRELSTPGVREQITEMLRARREQMLRTAYIAAARADADVTNHLARRLVSLEGRTPPAGAAGAN